MATVDERRGPGATIRDRAEPAQDGPVDTARRLGSRGGLSAPAGTDMRCLHMEQSTDLL